MTEGGATSTPARADAPGRLRLLQELVNSYDVETREEELPDAAALAAWLDDHGLAGYAAGDFSPADVEALHEVREGLRAVLLGRTGQPVDTGRIDRLNAVLATVPVRAALDGAGDVRLGAAGGLDALLAEVLDIVREAREAGTWERLKACAKHTCEYAFYDSARNKSGRWCSMSVCGNRVKVAKAYRRAAERKTGAPGSGAD